MMSSSEGLKEGNSPNQAAAGVVFLAADSFRQGSELVDGVPVPGPFWANIAKGGCDLKVYCGTAVTGRGVKPTKRSICLSSVKCLLACLFDERADLGERLHVAGKLKAQASVVVVVVVVEVKLLLEFWRLQVLW